MKTKSWKKYMCLMGISLMMMPAVCAMQTAEGGNGDNPVKKTRSTTFISGEKAWEPAGEGVTRQTHYHTQTTYVASGKFEFTVGNEKKTVKAGDGIYIEPDILHGCVCLEPGVLIDCFAPMRSDFLK